MWGKLVRTRDRTRKSQTQGLLGEEVRLGEVKTGELGLQRLSVWGGVFGGLHHSQSFIHHPQMLTSSSITASVYQLPAFPCSTGS